MKGRLLKLFVVMTVCLLIAAGCVRPRRQHPCRHRHLRPARPPQPRYHQTKLPT